VTPDRDVTPPVAAIRWDLPPVLSEPVGPILALAVAFLRQPAPDVLDRDPHWRATFLVEQLALRLVARDADAAASREALQAATARLHTQHVTLTQQRDRIGALVDQLRALRRPAA
jgi:hypothetical protein